MRPDVPDARYGVEPDRTASIVPTRVVRRFELREPTRRVHETMTTETVSGMLEDCSSALVVTHTRADFDALGSGIAIVDLFDGDGSLVVPGGVEKRAQRLLDLVAVAPDDAPDVSPADYDVAVVVDAPSSERIAPVDVVDRDVELVVIDHHVPADLAAHADGTLIDTDAGATAELVYRLAADAGRSFGPDSALALAVGILDDTGHLVGGGPAQFRMVAELLDAAGSHRESVL